MSSSKLKTYADNVAKVRAVLPEINNRAWEFIQDAGDGEATRNILRMVAVRPLAYVYNDTIKFINGYKNPEDETVPLFAGAPIDIDALQVNGFTREKSMENVLDELRYIEGVLLSPFVYDSRENYRWPAIHTLITAMEVLENLVNRLQSPSTY